MASNTPVESNRLDSVDYILAGADIYDGLGGTPSHADIAIAGDLIVDIGEDLGRRFHAARTIDAKGLAAAPGFIDIHTHSDLSVLMNPRMESSIHQGVTTEVVGNCGMAVGAMTRSGEFAFERRFLERAGLELTWDSFAEFLDLVQERGSSINLCSLVGHGTIRKLVMGNDERAPDAGELSRMRDAVRAAMAAGAIGLSTGLEYLPGGYADVDEIVALAEAAHEAQGYYASHIRNEGDQLIESVSEAIAVGKRTGIPVQVSHLKAEGRKNWGKVLQVLALMRQTRESGLDVLTDQYPYTAFMTGLGVVLLPKWAMSGSPDDVAARLVKPETRGEIRKEILFNEPDWSKIRIGVARNRRDVQGLDLAQLGEREGKHPVDAALDLMADEHGWVAAAHFALSDEDVETVLRDPHTMIGSDGVSSAPAGVMGEDKTHPRTYGTFPRVLGFCVREKSIIPLAEAIRRMTSLPALRIGLRDRGRIAPGMKADITVFSPQTVADRATFETPHLFAAGIEHVFVNGRLSLTGGQQRDIRAGRILRRSGGVVA